MLMKKNTLSLWFDLVWSDKTQIILLSVVFSVITISSILAYQKVDDYLSVFEKAHDSNTIVYENSDSISMELVHRIEALESVSSLNTLSNEVMKLPPENPKGKLHFEFVDASRIYQEPEKIYPVKITTGEIIDELKPNEVILDSRASVNYNVGDTISFQMYDFSEPFDEKIMDYPIKTIDLTVRGFISDNYKMIVFANDWGYGTLENMFLSSNDYTKGIWFTDIKTGERIPTCVLLTGRILDRSGKEIDAYLFDPSRLIIQLNDGYKIDDFLDDTKDLIEDRINKVYSYETLANTYIDDYSDGIGSSLNYFIGSFILIIVSVVGILINWYVRKRNELFVYYLLGLHWKACVGISVSPYIISLILGFLIGIGIAFRLPEWMIDKNRIEFNIGLVIFLGMIIVYVLCCIPYYLSFLKKNPIEMYQARE